MSRTTPLIVVNFKGYDESTGDGAIALAKACVRAAKEVMVVAVPQTVDIPEVVRAGKLALPVFAQHVDPVKPGAHTGSVSPESVRDAGCVGTLINHSEKRLDPKVIVATLQRCKETGLLTMICAQNVAEARKYAKLNPDFIAYEPPELIGGTISVSTAKPDLIKKTVDAVKGTSKKTKVLCGAGVHGSEDLRVALKLGCVGVLVASAIDKSGEPLKVMKELARGAR